MIGRVLDVVAEALDTVRTPLRTTPGLSHLTDHAPVLHGDAYGVLLGGYSSTGVLLDAGWYDRLACCDRS